MKRFFVTIVLLAALVPAFGQGFTSAKDVRKASYAGNEPRFRALIYYSDHVEEAHREFAHQAIDFFKKLTVGDGFVLDVDTRLPEDLSML